MKDIVSNSESSPKSLVKENGIYLITGGMGELGYIFAQYLARKASAGLIITGRSTPDERINSRLKELRRDASTVLYIKADISDMGDVKKIANTVRSEFHSINGIIHTAGVNMDSFILKKEQEEVRKVLSAKVQGTKNLDEVFKNDKLDFFVLFSSIASVFGNIGQSDYGYANGYMDYFAQSREQQREKGNRYGKTLSINWPLWNSGKMTVDSEKLNDMENGSMKMRLLENDEGIRAFELGLMNLAPQLIVVKGDEAEIDEVFGVGKTTQSLPKISLNEEKLVCEKIHIEEDFEDEINITTETEDYLKKVVSLHTKIPVNRIRVEESFGNYGIESVTIMAINKSLEKDLGEISKTLFFEYGNIRELTEYLLRSKEKELATLFVKPVKGKERNPSSKSVSKTWTSKNSDAGKNYSNITQKSEVIDKKNSEDIAIIGISGKYPMADNMNELWENLKAGKDCITKIPEHRWNNDLYYDAEKGKPGKSYGRWGGFVNDVEMFDPMFFKIPPVEAEFIDPHERLFLQTVWEAVEDAGYTRKSLSDEKVGVFTGIMYALYQMYETNAFGGKMIGRSSFASVANRVSYFFDFKGPSIALDTMCSSSLTAIYLACESIRSGASTMAVAGGVNLSLHPDKYVQLSQGGFLSTDGRCRSFGDGGDGYVPGEGVGAVILKTLDRAVEDGDQIYGVIKAVLINSGGKTSGYTVPNLNAQRELIKDTLMKGNIDARTISYIEAHGTGTALGDPIEINAISQAYREYSDKSQYCSIGSLKSNIGHLESAAGVAALAKVLLQMKYKKLVPSLHSDKLNSFIHFQDSPLYVQHGISEWEQPIVDGKKYPRRAGISAFGAGGSNAHLIIEEYENNMEMNCKESGRDCLFILSAKSQERLKEYAGRIHSFIKNCFEPDLKKKEHSNTVKSIVTIALADILGVNEETIQEDDSFEELGIDVYRMEQLRESIIDKFDKEITALQFMSYYNVKQLAEALYTYFKADIDETEEVSALKISLENIAYTLQVGREAMDERVAIIASDYKSLLNSLEDYISGTSDNTRFKHGNVNDCRDKFVTILNNEGIKEYLKQILKAGQLEQATEFWLMGVQIEWSILHANNRRLKVSVPLYPFAKERYWIIPKGTEDRLLPDEHVNNLKQNPRSLMEKKSNMVQVTEKIQTVNNVNLKSAMAEYIKQAFVSVLKIPYKYLSITEDYEVYGIDSIHISQLNKYFELHFGKLPSTLLFTYKTIKLLADYFVNEHANKVLQFLNATEQAVETVQRQQEDFGYENYPVGEISSSDMKPEIQEEDSNDIAIIGISGRFPQAEGLDTYFKNLEEGKDCISTIPTERWNWRDYPEITCKWGGFIEDVDKFDPQFFNISPAVAAFMDPQERLFVQAVWSCLEDAGYTPQKMGKSNAEDSRSNVSVYAGVTFNEYGLYGAGDIAKGKAAPLNSQIYSIANRISYLFNLGGPSLSVDTACSSSLYAVHLGCESILRGECDMAVAGGVNLSLHQSKYITLDWANFLASDGHCRTFGKDGDGYVPGEGVGAVLLKPLWKARQDRDHVYAVIKGSAVNHGGKTYGYSVPNPVAQSEVIEKALRKSGVNPRTISYVEAHGTGTTLGDPIEITALTDTYKSYTQDKQYCAIGSVKSNIGHLEAAAGISQLIKVILQMKNKELVPSRLNSDELNPNIDFESTPFYVQLKKEEWKRPVLGKEQKEYPRRAGISAFGVGGVNVHLIVEEYETPYETAEEVKESVVVQLSAKNEKTLKNYVSTWLAYIQRTEGRKELLPDIRDAAYTLQNGRVELTYRAAFVVNNYKQLMDMFQIYLNGDRCEGIYTGKVLSVQLKVNTDDLLSSEIEVSNSAKCAADRWVQGRKVTFDFMYQNYNPKKVPLPGYPFEKESYWMYSKNENTDPSRNIKAYESTEISKETESVVKPQKNVKKENIADRLRNAYEGERMEITVQHIQGIFAQLLGFAEGRLPDVEEGFFALGLESVATRQAYNIMEDEFQIELDEQIFFNYPNITEVSKYILSMSDFDSHNKTEAVPDNVKSSKPSDNETLLFEHKWVLTEQLKSSKSLDKDRVLFVGMGDELVALVKEYTSQSALKNMIFVGNEDKPCEVLDSMESIPDKIVFAGCLNDQKKGIINIDYRMDEGIVKIFDIVKYLVNKAEKNISLFYIYKNDEDIVSAEYGGVNGFFRTLQMENPKFMCKTVSICADMKDNDEIVKTIIKEVKAGCIEKEIEYKDKERYARRVCELSSENVSRPCLFKERGVYLIVGGTGGLSNIFSKYLSKKYHARLIISGRKNLSEHDNEQLKDIETFGGRAVYIKADISDQNDTKNLVQKATECFGHINGVIHMAGVVRDAMIQNKTTEDFKTVLAAKVYGTQYLDEELKDKDLDFFVIFSSLASVMGNIGQSDYCYANSFIDHFAQVRDKLCKEGLRSGKTYSINWSFWQNGGMTVDRDSQKWMDKKLGLILMDNEQGIEALEKSMRAETSQVILMNGRPKKIREVLQLPEPRKTYQETKNEDNVFLQTSELPKEIEELSEENLLDLLEMLTMKDK